MDIELSVRERRRATSGLGVRAPRAEAGPRSAPAEVEAGAITVYPLAPDQHPAQPADRAEPHGIFRSVLWAVDKSASNQAARSHAAFLASPGGTVELCSGPGLLQQGTRSLHDGCEGHDLLVLGAGASTYTAVQQAPIPILIARQCSLGTEITDSILVPVDNSPESSGGVKLSGRLAAAHGGTVTILAVPQYALALEQAVAASARTLLRATGAAPRVLGEPLPPQRTIPSAAASLTASLVVLGSGSSELRRSRTAQLAACLGCSVLVIPGSIRVSKVAAVERSGSSTQHHLETAVDGVLGLLAERPAAPGSTESVQNATHD